MYRDQTQRQRVCHTLLHHGVSQSHRFVTGGIPNELAEAGLSDYFPLARSDRIMLKVMFAFWNGNRAATVAEVITLEPRLLQMIGRLVQVVNQSPNAIDGWLARYGLPDETSLEADLVEDQTDWPVPNSADEREAALTAAQRNGCFHPFARPRL